jgi:hypothetical protein
MLNAYPFCLPSPVVNPALTHDAYSNSPARKRAYHHLSMHRPKPISSPATTPQRPSLRRISLPLPSKSIQLSQKLAVRAVTLDERDQNITSGTRGATQMHAGGVSCGTVIGRVGLHCLTE